MKIRGWIGGGVKFLNEKNTPFVFRKFSSFYSNVYLLMHVNQQSTFACVAKGDSFTVVSRCKRKLKIDSVCSCASVGRKERSWHVLVGFHCGVGLPQKELLA